MTAGTTVCLTFSKAEEDWVEALINPFFGLEKVKQTVVPAVMKLPVAAPSKPVFEPLTKELKASDAAKQGRDLWLEKRDFGRNKRKSELKAAAKK
jgi:hypothetical protein